MGAPRRLRLGGAGLRLTPPRPPRRRLAALLDARQRHRLARPRRLLRSGRSGLGRAGREQPHPRRRSPGAPGRRRDVVLLRPRPHPPPQRCRPGLDLGARLQPAAVADGPVPRRRRRHSQAGLAVLRRRTTPDLTALHRRGGRLQHPHRHPAHGRGDHGDEEGGQDGAEEPTDVQGVQETRRDPEEGGVDHEGEEPEGDQHQRQRQQPEQRADDGVDQAEDGRDAEQGEYAAVDVDGRHQGRGDREGDDQ